MGRPSRKDDIDPPPAKAAAGQLLCGDHPLAEQAGFSSVWYTHTRCLVKYPKVYATFG